MELVHQRLGVGRTTISPQHPQGTSQVERFMRYLNAALTICLERYPDWPLMPPLVLFAYRTMPHATTGYSPCFLLFGREAKLPLHVVSSPPKPGDLFEMI
jgi:hypothetical protein